MKKHWPFVFFIIVLYTHHATPSDSQDPITDETATQGTGSVDVRALDDLIIDLPEPDLEQLKMPMWKTWLMRAADTMFWTVHTGKDAVMTAYGRCKKLIITSDEPDEIES